MRVAWNKGLKGVQKGWNKGLTKETNKSVKRISESKIGKKRLDMIDNKYGFSRGNMKGNKHWNWKGGITSVGKSLRVKFRIEMQKKVFERDNYTCQLCGSKKDLQVDHIQSWAEYVELRFCMDNCRTICGKCHYQITYSKPMPKNIKTWGHNLKHSEIINYRQLKGGEENSLIF